MKEKKTKHIDIRVTEKQYNLIKKKAGEGNSMSYFIINAAEHYDDKYLRKRIDVIEAAGEAFAKWNGNLRKFAGNINAIANYCNRCRILGIDDTEPIKEVGKYVDNIRELFQDVNTFHIRFLSFINRYKRHWKPIDY